jgi:hypothetical protein
LAIAPIAQKRGITCLPSGRKNSLCIFAFGKNGKNWIQISFVNCFAIPNHRLLSRKAEFEFVRPYDLIPKYRAFCEARPAPASPCGINSGGASEQQKTSDFEKSLIWSQLLNEARTFFERKMLE